MRVSTKAFALIWRVVGSPLGTGGHSTMIDANTKNNTRRWNTCTPSCQLHPPSTGKRVGACDSMVPVCACGECGDEREVSGELKKEKRANVARRYCYGCEVCCGAGSTICVCWRGWSMNEESASISRVFVVGFSTFIAETGAGGAPPSTPNYPRLIALLAFPTLPLLPPTLLKHPMPAPPSADPGSSH